MKKIVQLALVLSLAVSTVLFAQTSKFSLNARVSGNLGTIDLDESTNNKSMNLGISNTDTFGIEISDKMAGAKVSLKGSDLIDSSNGGTIVVDDYYGWMKFGDLKLTAGEWDHRYANRVTSDSSNFGGLWDLKYGVIARKAGNEGAITVAVAMVKDYFGVRAAYKAKDLADVSASFVMNGENKGDIGIFISPNLLKNLTLVVGYSGNYDFKVSDNNKHAGELRARYMLDKLSFTTHNNISMGDKNMIMYDMLNVSYKFSDTIVPSIMVANSNFSGDKATWKGNVFTVRPGVTFIAQKGASIDAGLRFKMTSPESGTATKVMDFPVVFRIKF